MLSRFQMTAAVALCVGLSVQSLQAVPITFFGEDVAGGSLPVPNSSAAQAAFLSNISSAGVEDFESFSYLQGSPIVATFSPFGDTATITGFEEIEAFSSSAGRFAISGTKYLQTDNGQGLSLTFSAPQAIFGFFGTDVGDFGGQLTLSFDGGTPINVPNSTNAANGTALFFGYIDEDNPFSTVVFGNTNSSSDVFGFDDFTIGRAAQVQPTVPEPTSIALFGIGALGLIGFHRRKCFVEK